MNYSLVNAAGQIVRHLFTDNPDAYVPPGHRLLPDNPPAPGPYQLVNPELPVPEYATTIPYVVSYMDLAEVKVRKKDSLTTQRNMVIVAGVEFEGNTFAADPTSIINLTSSLTAVQAGLQLPPDYGWRNVANVKIPMNSIQLRNLGDLMLQLVNSAYNNSWVKKDAVDAATTVEDVIAVQW